MDVEECCVFTYSLRNLVTLLTSSFPPVSYRSGSTSFD